MLRAGSPALFSQEDGEIIEGAIADAVKNPVVREFDARKLARRPKAFETKTGLVAVPEEDVEEACGTSPYKAETEATEHTLIQEILLRMGSGMGIRLWLPHADRGRRTNAGTLGDIKGVIPDLPTQFDQATTKTIRNIDVLWLERSAIVAAFEIDSTMSIYSGLLRMADLMAMQPNLNIPLYIVAPEERREKVLAEVNRPAFVRLPQPMSEDLASSHLAPSGTACSPLERYCRT
ncbi:MAG: hypothetical protein AB7V19_02115 [Candidatus Bipolaricaulia bacterium]